MKKLIFCVANFMFIALGCSLIVGCSSDGKFVKGETQTVEWFMDHSVERETILSACNNNVELRSYPNCRNAKQAESGLKTIEEFNKVRSTISTIGED